jgi:hypothetical protein
MTRADARRWTTCLGLLLLLLATGAAAREAPWWQGRPDFTKGEALGYFVWRDAEGWHVRWTTKGKRRTFSGTVSCDGAFMQFAPVAKGRRDYVKKVAEHTIKFDTVVEGGMDGIDFRLSPSTETVTFDLLMDGERVAPELVRVGAGKTRPPKVPFSIDRQRR